jgi:hypothetical protein
MGHDGMFAFTSFEDLINFVFWVTSSFDDVASFNEWLENRTADFSKIDNEFWSIINNGFYKQNTELPGSD